MHLNPELGEVKGQIFNFRVRFVLLQNHKIFIVAPWFVCKDIFNVSFTVKNEKYNMVSKVFQSEAIFGTP